LTALFPLRPARLAALAEARVARRSVPCSASGASSGAPPGTAFSAVPEASGSASDALCRARYQPSSRTTFPGARTAAPAPLVKEGGASRSSAPFHRRRAPSRLLAQAPSEPLAGFLQSIRCTSATAWTTPSPPRRVRLPSPVVGMAAALLRAPPAGAFRSRGPVAALAASASTRQCPDELSRNRSLPSTSFHEPVPRAGWRSRPRAASPPQERSSLADPRLRESRAITLRAACAGAPARGFGLVRIT